MDNPYSPVDIKPGNNDIDISWIFPVFVAAIIVLSIWWEG